MSQVTYVVDYICKKKIAFVYIYILFYVLLLEETKKYKTQRLRSERK